MKVAVHDNAISVSRFIVVERGTHDYTQRTEVALGDAIRFSTAGLESYSFSRWEPILYDAMVVAATIEYADRTVRRPSQGWARQISVCIPVHDPDRWNMHSVLSSLQDALEFLTGDYWEFRFRNRTRSADPPLQNLLGLPVDTQAVLSYSDGLDSLSVAKLLNNKGSRTLLRVRVGSKVWDSSQLEDCKDPFAMVPYRVSCRQLSKEPSCRSRGFRFAMITGVAAYLANADEIVVPESGQGIIGPALVYVGQAYPDFRNHPFFVVRMQRFINALFGTKVKFIYPRIWCTKGQTLGEYISLFGERGWERTRSCWKNSRWCSVNGERRQCGVCAACMLRRLSVHAAGQVEKRDAYVTTCMRATTLDGAIDIDFARRTSAFDQYAIAGALHMQYLAEMGNPEFDSRLRGHSTLLARYMGLNANYVKDKLTNLFEQHSHEWKSYLDSLGQDSFVKRWTG